MKYTFQAETERKIEAGSSHIRGIYNDFADPNHYKKQVLALGQLKTLFGEPLYISEDLENQFEYCITAISEDGERISLYAYSAGTGPAIGGNHDEKSKEAADALAEYICSAEPTDYDYEGYYMDGPCRVKQGVKNGVPYMSEEELMLTPEEAEEVYRRLYNL